MFRTYFREWSSMSERIKKGKASSCSSCLFLSLEFLLPQSSHFSFLLEASSCFFPEGGILTWLSKPKMLQAWSLVTAHLGNDLWSSLMELLVKNEKEMLQDRCNQKLLDFLEWCCHQQRCPKQEHGFFTLLQEHTQLLNTFQSEDKVVAGWCGSRGVYWDSLEIWVIVMISNSNIQDWHSDWSWVPSSKFTDSAHQVIHFQYFGLSTA